MAPRAGPPPAACVLHSEPLGGTFDSDVSCPRSWTARLCLGGFGGRKWASAADVEQRIRTTTRLGRSLVSHLSPSSLDVLLTSSEKRKKLWHNSVFPLLPSSSSFILFFCTVGGSSVESKETKHMNFSTSTTQSFRLEATVTGLQVNIHCVNILLFPILQIYYL